MTIERFNEIQQEIIELVVCTLNDVEKTCVNDYILLLIRADYYDFMEKYPECKLFPYVIDNPNDIRLDISRQRFLRQYLNEYILKLENRRCGNLEYLEYEINIQLMMYAHTWESRLYLKALERVAYILSRKGYKWKSNIKTSKSNFINYHIKKLLVEGQFPLGEYIEKYYDAKLRNCMSHSTYYIDCIGKKIHIEGGNSILWKKTIAFTEWEEMFLYTILLSYHLTTYISSLRNNFINIYGTNPMILKRPLIKVPKKFQEFCVIPEYYNISGKKLVRFKYVSGNNGRFT